MYANLLQPKNTSRLRITAFFFVLLVLFVFVLFRLERAWIQYQTTETKIENLKKRLLNKPVAKPTKNQQEDQKQWMILANDMQYPWGQLFQSLERASNNEIELLQFQPDKTSKNVLLVGEAKSQKSLEAFLIKLERDQNLHEVHLTHQEYVRHDHLETVQFEIKAVTK
jgi:hypothetical protein